jgi:hypothetical protein
MVGFLAVSAYEELNLPIPNVDGILQCLNKLKTKWRFYKRIWAARWHNYRNISGINSFKEVQSTNSNGKC